MFETRRVRSVAVGLACACLVAAVSAGYEVRPGDTLAEIARENGVTVAAITEANGISDPNLIRIGQVLTIPGVDGGEGGRHVVALGDTLAGIAAAYHTTVAALIQANTIANPNLIRVGQELVIPAGASAGPSEAPAGEPVVHVVEPGESLASIAAAHGTTATAIAAANGITDPSVIYAGTTLVINGPPTPVVTGGGSASTHVVATGETLGGIAARYETTVGRIAELNGIVNPNLIVAGQELTVPAGSWLCPVVGARYFNDFGFPRSGGRAHEGIDLFAPRGTEVRAPVAGTVDPRTGTVGGLQFWLTGDDGNLYIGAHLQAFGVVGRVSAGDVIGYIGDTGNALGSEPHLHFEMQVGGVTTNPYPTLTTNGC